MWSCSSCKTENPDSARNCQSCGILRKTAGDQSPPSFFEKKREQQPSVPVRKITDYLTENRKASWLDMIGTVYIVVGAIAAVIGGLLVSLGVGLMPGRGGFWSGLIVFLVILIPSLIQGFLLQAIAAVLQNTQDQLGYMQYMIALDKDHRKQE